MKATAPQTDIFKNRVSEISLTYHSEVKPADRLKISASRDADQILRPFFVSCIEHRERMVMILLNRNNQVLAVMHVSEGGTAGTVADPKIIFQAALKTNASGIILAHNHPSGNKQPSQADIQMTKQIKEGGKYLEIQILDHLILTNDGFTSLADEGFM